MSSADVTTTPAAGPTRPGVPLTAVAATLVALAWVPLGLIHPTGEHMLDGHTATWLAVHWVQTALVPLVGLSMWRVLDLPGHAATVARVAVMIWVASLAAFGGIAAIANGLLVEAGHTQAAIHLWEQTHAGAVLPMGIVAHLSWVVGAVAGSLALHANRAPYTARVAMLLAALLMATGHGDAFSSAGAVALAVAVFVTLTTRTDQPRRSGRDAAAAASFDTHRLAGMLAPTASKERLGRPLAAAVRRVRGRRLAVGLIGLVGCGVTTVLIATGVLAAGGGVLGGPRVAVSAASILIALQIWRVVRRRQRVGGPQGA